ncbi:MAG: DNA (cytosine-5-)-methyltransferase [Bacteroidetes bacterium]|nr:MAG: DNA (cytosine-5-)-methyltransferase [Bacteroidota bacterium]
MRVVSLFSGAGGLDFGFHRAGHDVVWAVDHDRDAVATYRKNLSGGIVCAGIEEVDVASIPDCDVVIGGFPCQGFSQANLRRDAGDLRNALYLYFLDVVREKQPDIFIAENVKGILSLEKGEAIRRIVGDFEGAGYSVEVHSVNLANYGVPQSRQRVFIVGRSLRPRRYSGFTFPEPTHSKRAEGGLLPWVTVRDALEHFPDPDVPNGVANHVYSSYRVAFRNFTAHRRTDPEKPCPTILARGNGQGGVCAIPHYNGLRRLTVRESAAVQTFPDDFEFVGSMTSCYRQIGNAVPCLFSVRLAEAVGEMQVLCE